jgi:hypothetical protein
MGKVLLAAVGSWGGSIVRRLFLFLSVLSFAVPAHAEWWEARTQDFII